MISCITHPGLLLCIEQGFTGSEAAAVLKLTNDTRHATLAAAWKAAMAATIRGEAVAALKLEIEDEYTTFKVRNSLRVNREDFNEIVGVITDDYDTVTWCDDCDLPVWEDESQPGPDGGTLCSSCRDQYWRCDGCEDLFRETSSIGSHEYCESCRDERYSWCEECEEYFRDEDDHSHSCNCEVPIMRFRFPADGQGTVEQDERLNVDLPKGTIDEEGLIRIGMLVNAGLDWDHNSEVTAALTEVGPAWQMKRGNFTRRLSSALHKRGLKLKPETISEIGNLARQHSSADASWEIELTRDLNLPAYEFYHEESCWWGSYAESRCCLKNWGGLGIRSFAGNGVRGRAWVQPIKRREGNIVPTHDTMGADGYIVFNGYGDLTGYVAARIIAHLTGHTYKRIEFNAESMYVNNEAGYLVAAEDVCIAVEEVYFRISSHDRCDARESLVTV